MPRAYDESRNQELYAGRLSKSYSSLSAVGVQKVNGRPYGRLSTRSEASESLISVSGQAAPQDS